MASPATLIRQIASNVDTIVDTINTSSSSLTQDHMSIHAAEECSCKECEALSKDTFTLGLQKSRVIYLALFTEISVAKNDGKSRNDQILINDVADCFTKAIICKGSFFDVIKDPDLLGCIKYKFRKWYFPKKFEHYESNEYYVRELQELLYGPKLASKRSVTSF